VSEKFLNLSVVPTRPQDLKKYYSNQGTLKGEVSQYS
jgi:hypothetical protein